MAGLPGPVTSPWGSTGAARSFLESTASNLQVRKKSRTIVLGNLALTHIRERNLDEATAALHEAIDAVTVTRGGGGLNVVFQAGRASTVASGTGSAGRL